MFSSLLFRSFVTVVFPCAVMCYIVYHGHFSVVHVELGQEHYAETIDRAMFPWLPKWVKMPMNTIVNIGYVVLGAYWCALTSAYWDRKYLNDSEAFILFVFNIMACVYGPIQTLRILTQLHGFAVLDQWVTLPIFMWTVVWGLYLHSGWNTLRAYILTLVSIFSYVLSLYSVQGFEIALGFHVVCAVAGGLVAWKKYPGAKVLFPLIGAYISCIGFVVLKLLDLHLPRYHEIFRIFSGHFVSKICDILQIHFTNEFFFRITMHKYYDSKKKKE